MFGKILNFKFTSISEAKLAASFCSEKFGSKISEYNIVGLNIFINDVLVNMDNFSVKVLLNNNPASSEHLDGLFIWCPFCYTSY